MHSGNFAVFLISRMFLSIQMDRSTLDYSFTIRQRAILIAYFIDFVKSMTQ